MNRDLNYQKDVYTNFFEVCPGVWGMKDVFVNMYMVLNPFEGNWVLIDAGLKWSAPKIRKMANQLFGENTRPSAIILTHGHFDHVGSLESLAEEWDVPIYAHYLELPYLTGKSSYPPADPTVGGGLMASASWLYPVSPINVWSRVNVLPGDGRIPGLPEWKYIHTPGHAPGHISLFRTRDGVLIAGDAFVTTKAESALSVMMQTRKISGPPKYLTYDWHQARESVRKLADLGPEIVATGHGRPMSGPEMRSDLYILSRNFDEVALPEHGRYVASAAAADSTGVIYVPPKEKTKAPWGKIAGLLAVGVAAYVVYRVRRYREEQREQLLAYETF